jgi:pilus assembly protein CpaF
MSKHWINGFHGKKAADTQEPKEQQYLRFKREVYHQLRAWLDLVGPPTGTGPVMLGVLSPFADLPPREEEFHQELRQAAEGICRFHCTGLSAGECERLVTEVLEEIVGLGPLQVLLEDGSITDILVNGPKTVYIERQGRWEKAGIAFHNDQHLREFVERIAGWTPQAGCIEQLGCGEELPPLVDVRLSDGSHLRAILPPLALDGSVVAISRAGRCTLSGADLLAQGTLAPEMLEFLKVCVRGRLNLLIAGGPGSGRTTLLNVLAAFLADDERIVTIEEAAELWLPQPHVTRLLFPSPVGPARRPGPERQVPRAERDLPNRGERISHVTAAQLLRSVLGMRPDRILVGDCRGEETLELLQALATGQAASLATINAPTPRDALNRLEVLAGLADRELPPWLLRRQAASAIDIVVQVARFADGSRKLVTIAEVADRRDDGFGLEDLFLFQPEVPNPHPVARGHFYATGTRPRCIERLVGSGAGWPAEMFAQRRLTS